MPVTKKFREKGIQISQNKENIERTRTPYISCLKYVYSIAGIWIYFLLITSSCNNPDKLLEDNYLKSLNTDPSKVNELDQDGYTQLYVASQKGYDKAVRALLEVPGIDVNKKSEDDSKGGFTSLYAAAAGHHIKIVQLLLNHPKILVNQPNNHSYTPLHITAATTYRDTKIAELLLAHPDINVNPKDKHGETPLHWAAYRGIDQVEVLRVLLQVSGILNRVNEKNDYGETPLHSAAKKGHLEIIKELLKTRGILVNPKDQYGNTPA